MIRFDYGVDGENPLLLIPFYKKSVPGAREKVAFLSENEVLIYSLHLIFSQITCLRMKDLSNVEFRSHVNKLSINIINIKKRLNLQSLKLWKIYKSICIHNILSDKWNITSLKRHSLKPIIKNHLWTHIGYSTYWAHLKKKNTERSERWKCGELTDSALSENKWLIVHRAQSWAYLELSITTHPSQFQVFQMYRQNSVNALLIYWGPGQLPPTPWLC